MSRSAEKLFTKALHISFQGIFCGPDTSA